MIVGMYTQTRIHQLIGVSSLKFRRRFFLASSSTTFSGWIEISWLCSSGPNCGYAIFR